MKTMFSDSAHGGAVRTGQPAWRRALAIMLIALLSPVPALLAFWADANSDWQPDSWVDPLSGHVFTLSELDAFSDDIDGDGLSNSQEMWIGTNPFSPDTDGDGISDLLDPLPLSASNLSPANGIVWGAIAPDDADGDGIPNFLDEFPYGLSDIQVGNPDTDGDGIPDIIDPAPWDYSNWSPVNGLQWMGDAFADADGDGVPNFHDWYPYDASLWDPLQDPDGDGFVKAKDPRPSDPYNPSPVNGLNWGTEVYGDADGDGIPNFYDAYPYDSSNGFVPSEPDSDGDGIPDSVDPSPWDYDNFSAANGVSWQGDARGDADGDGISNFYDQFPYDYYNGNMPVSDMDGDGIPDAEDPAPSDPTNLSPINGGLWYTAALADADGDGNPNFTDPWPYDPTNGNLPPEWNSPTADTDGDGIANAQDPALADPLNFSIYNGTSWYADAIGDVDGDGIVNFQDAYPYDYYNGSYAGPDSDGDGMPDSSDPYPNDPNNGNGDADGDGIVDSQDPYPFDANNGGTVPEPDTDGDGRPDSQDPYPNDPSDNADFDQDGIPDVSDPAQSDRNNHSSFNGVEWYADVRGDADGDTILNFWDLEPYGPTPVDTDGDGMLDSIDPAPEDPYNFSAYNKTIWSSDALGDADGDGIPNYFDTWPYDSLNGTGDADMDGLPDASDPVPEDPYNNSSHNGAMWSGTSALGDVDNDGILNYFDAYPDDPYNGLPPGGDADGDGIPNEQDPDPRNGTNTSPYNGINWGEGANGDADNDGTANYWDYTPFGDDRDGDGIRDDLDPAPDDWTNYSEANQREWYADALGDNDLDYDLNFYDPEPDGGPPREPDVPQPSASASPLVILNDGYDELGEPAAPGVTPDCDMADESLVIKSGSDIGTMATKGLTPLSLVMPFDYVNAGGSVTITQSRGSGSVRIHAVLTEGGVGVGEQPVALGSAFVPLSYGSWTYWIEGVTEGDVSLNFHFPQKMYGGVDSLHQQGAMAEDVDVPIDFTVCSAHLSVDYDRDGLIEPGSYADATFEYRPFRFWVNDDDDSGVMGGDDITKPSSTDAADSGLSNDGSVDGTRDLVDFFPISLDIKQLISMLPPSASIKYKLKHTDSALNLVYTNFTRNQALVYHKKLLTTGFSDDFDHKPGDAVTHRVTASGVELSTAFLNGAINNDWSVLLIEGRIPTTAPLVLSVEKEGATIVELRLELRLSRVEEMFRHVDLTGAVKNYNGSVSTPPEAIALTRTSDPGDPWPDSLTNGKYFVFVHGYNVDGQKARGWNCEIYKRMHVLGSKSRFVGVTWHGATGKDYHKAVYQAFQTGDAIGSALNFTSGADVTIAAHSLGNMVVSHAIQSGYSPSRYYMINAAVPVEAYDFANVDSTQLASMVEDDWKSRDSRFYVSNWHKLFSSTPGDRRNELSWKNRFIRARRDIETYNFYSLGEDVVENAATDSAGVAVQIWNQGADFFSGKGAWTAQEMVKGVNWTTSLADLFLERGQAGWDADFAYSLTPNATITNEQLKTRPFFDEFIEEDLINANPAIASAKAGEAQVQYDLLARGLPALSYAAAANRIIALDQVDPARNFDMETKGRTYGQWPTEGHSGANSGKWLHSDFKVVALPYVYQMYEAMIAKKSLK